MSGQPHIEPVVPRARVANIANVLTGVRLVLVPVFLVVLFAVVVVGSFPATWLLMLFLGNVGAALSYWAVLPLGVVVSLVIGAGSSGGYRY